MGWQRHYSASWWRTPWPLTEAQYNAALSSTAFKKSHRNMPSYREMRAIHSALQIARREGSALVNLADYGQSESAFRAQVIVRDNHASAAILEESEQADIGSFITRKSWTGVPEWPIRGETAMKRIPGGRVNIYAPPSQGHVVYEDVHVFHQQRIHHHRRPAEHIQHGQPETVNIGYDPAQVNVHHNAPPIVRHHHAPQGFWSALFKGVQQPQAIPQYTQPQQAPQYAPPPQQALPAPQPQYRGELRALPAPQPQRQTSTPPVALPAPREQPMPVMAMQPQRKKVGWF